MIELKPHSRIKKITNIVFVDTESTLNPAPKNNKTYHMPYLICANFCNISSQRMSYKSKKFCNKELTFDGSDKMVSDFWKYLLKYKKRLNIKKLYICAHNAKYDSLILKTLDFIQNSDYEIVQYSFANPFFITFKNEKKEEITFFSSTNIFQTSIKKLGKMLKLDKIEYDYFSNGINWKKAITYCRRDVKILRVSMLKYFYLIQTFGAECSAKITIASQAFETYRQCFLPTSNVQIWRDDKIQRHERIGYKGGRCECYKIGKFENIYSLDINSMYPFQMKCKKLPYKFKGSYPCMTVDEMQTLINNDNEYVYAYCEIDTPYPIFGKRLNNKLCFPVGHFWEFLHKAEIKKGLEKNLIKRIGQTYIYYQDYLFTDYVNYFYEKRSHAKQEKNEIFSYFYKIFQNSLYGKFGQKKIETFSEELEESEREKIGSEIEVDLVTKKRYKVDYFCGKKWLNQTVGESYYSFPILAGAITAEARSDLWEFMEIAGIKNLYYSDTDSLFVNKEGYINLKNAGMLSETALGKLKLEKFCKTLTIRNCKDYDYTNEHEQFFEKKKGVNLKTAKRIDKNEYEVDFWTGYADFIRHNEKHYYTEKRIKKYNETYGKGVKLKNGNIQPFKLNESSLYTLPDYEY